VKLRGLSAQAANGLVEIEIEVNRGSKPYSGIEREFRDDLTDSMYQALTRTFRCNFWSVFATSRPFSDSDGDLLQPCYDYKYLHLVSID
jgi:hypothetical protein